MAKTVFAVWTGCYSDRDVHGIYSTREMADAAAKLLTRDDGRVEEYTLDADVAAVKRGKLRFDVSFYDDEDEPMVYSLGLGTGEKPDVSGEDVGYLSVRCDARDDAHALKIATDVRRAHLAEKAQLGGSHG